MPDYYDIIKEPMDFETMSRRLNDYYYKTKEMFIYDFNLVVNNCKTYNQVLTHTPSHSQSACRCSCSCGGLRVLCHFFCCTV